MLVFGCKSMLNFPFEELLLLGGYPYYLLSWRSPTFPSIAESVRMQLNLREAEAEDKSLEVYLRS